MPTGNCHGEAASNKMELEQCELMGENENFTTIVFSYFSVCFYWSQQSVTLKNRHSIFYHEQWHLKTKKARQSIHPFMERDRVENNCSRLGSGHVCVKCLPAKFMNELSAWLFHGLIPRLVGPLFHK